MQPLGDRVKVPLIIIAFSFLCLFVFSKLFGPIPFTINSIQTTKSDLFRVDGRGEAKGTPTQASFSVGVTETAPTVELAQQKANETINTITEELKKLGVEEADIKTSNYNAYPNYAPLQAAQASEKMMAIEAQGDYQRNTNRIISYTINENLDISVKQISLANKALDIASRNNADIISGISFTFDEKERKKLEEKARNEAITNAKEKAQSLANAAGIRLGNIADIQEYTNGVPFSNYGMGGGGEGVAKMDAQPTDLQPGQNTITVNVTLGYELN